MSSAATIHDSAAAAAANSATSTGDAAATAGGSNGTSSDHNVTRDLLAKCDWKDQTLWIARQLLGGAQINGFQTVIGSLNRIRRQRVRAINKAEGNAAAAAAAVAAAAATAATAAGDTNQDTSTATTKKRETSDSHSEEIKKEIMNARTAKKLRTEMEMGLSFCANLHGAVRHLLLEMDPTLTNIPPPISETTTPQQPQHSSPLPSLHRATTAPSTAGNNHNMMNKPPLSRVNSSPHHGKSLSSILENNPAAAAAAGVSSSLPFHPNGDAETPATNKNPRHLPSMLQQQQQQHGTTSSAAVAAASPGNPLGSTLRKHRKKNITSTTSQHSSSSLPELKLLSEFDEKGKRIVSKKEHLNRIFEVLRFRGLQQGDHVAARVSASRDLLILARVNKDYPSFITMMTPNNSNNNTTNEFLKLPEGKRDALFRDKVSVTDVTDVEKDSASATLVERKYVLPLPRSFGEAAEWCQRTKKGARVYAMYPHTTSLYSATVIDSTTYCKDDDDIIVVEFDGEDLDVKGMAPKFHIPSRFVTLIPREFPGSQANSSNGTTSATTKTKRGKLGGAMATTTTTTTGPPLNPLSSMVPKSLPPVTTTTTKTTNQQQQQDNNSAEQDGLSGMIGELSYADLQNPGGLDDSFDQFDFDFD